MLSINYDRLSRLLIDTGTISPAPVKWGKVKACSAGLLHATGFDYPIGTGAVVLSEDGQEVNAEVIGFDGAMTMLAPFDPDTAISMDAVIKPMNNVMQVDVGPSLMCRIVDPLGQPLDHGGPIMADAKWPLMGKKSNILNRGRITQALDVGVQAINALLPIGCGQRVALIAGSGVGKTVLVRQLASGTRVDVVVVGLIGERAREVSDFVAATAIAIPTSPIPVTNITSSAKTLARSIPVLNVDIVDQWVAKLSQDIKGLSTEKSTLSFQLKPNHLGKLHVAIATDVVGEIVRLETDNENAKALILASQGRLEQDIRLSGMKLARVDVTMQDQFGSQLEQQGSGSRGGEAQLVRDGDSQARQSTDQIPASQKQAAPNASHRGARYA